MVVVPRVGQRRRIFDNIMTPRHHSAFRRSGGRTMRTRFVIALATGAVLALGGAAMAQQPVPPADYGAPITNEQAKAVAAAAFAEAKKNNWRMAFTIVGPSGELVYF